MELIVPNTSMKTDSLLSAPPRPCLALRCASLAVASGAFFAATACNSTPAYAPDGNVFVQPRYGYGSPNQAPPTNNTGRPSTQSDGQNAAKPNPTRKTPDIRRDPSNTTVDVSPPESKPKKDAMADSSSTADSSGNTSSTASSGDSTTTSPEKDKPTDTTEAKPAAPREDLQYGQPVVGKKGFVYSPFAPDKGQVDVEGIPAGTKVKCPYTGKTFRVP